MTDAYAPTSDPQQTALARLVAASAEDAIFALSAALCNANDALEHLGKRRKDQHVAILQNARVSRMTENFDAWIVDMSQSMAAICPPSWMPMAEVLREKVTLEGGARGLRSLFSSKPSDKEIGRVKRLGTLAVRALRAVFAADGPLDGEEVRTVAALIASLGLPDVDAAPLYTEQPVLVEQIEVYGDLEPSVGRAIIRGSWLASAWDVIEPHEEAVVRALAQKVGVPIVDVEMMRNEAIARVAARQQVGLATVDAVRVLLSDREPGIGVQMAALAGTLMIPRRFRDEALATLRAGAPVSLSQRYKGISSDEKLSVLGIAWAAGLHEDPPLSRLALLRARHAKVAKDLGEDGDKARKLVEEMMRETLDEGTTGMI
ncbi:hypothetical protein BH09MYX1_BH09MYX1_13060 [soil metagenome]